MELGFGFGFGLGLELSTTARERSEWHDALGEALPLACTVGVPKEASEMPRTVLLRVRVRLRLRARDAAHRAA